MKKMALLASLIAPWAHAEIVLPTGEQADAFYTYEHPALRSLVFISPETRQLAILPPAPFFVSPPPLLLRAPTAMPAYPPVIALPGINTPARPSNRDNSNYNLQRAHSFSQKLYRENAPFHFGATAWSTYGYGWPAFGPAYAPALVPDFNQPARPSNRDNTTYNLERAHRFSMDGYRRP